MSQSIIKEYQNDFATVYQMITSAKSSAWQQVNKILIDLYWNIGQLQFYLEVLDRDIKKPHENPSIGILICKTKDEEVVKFAMNRNMSPTMIAEYETKLINKSLLQKKLQEMNFAIANIEEEQLE